MKQLELFNDDGPQPIQRWLHVWTDAERASRKKCPTPEAQGEDPANRVGGVADEAACQRVGLQGQESNPRPPGYEPGELPLLHLAIDDSACQRIQAASFSAGMDGNSGQISRQLVRKC